MAVDRTTILVVEDEIPIVELIRYTLVNDGCKVIIAPSVKDAWARLMEEVPALVLLDWMLPDQTGLQLLSRIRSEKMLKELPVIMLTAKSMEEDKIAGLNTGADDYVTKPFSPRELMARIHALLRRKKPEHGRAVLSAGPLSLDPASYEVGVNGDKIEINPSEFKLLKFLLAHPDRVFSRDQLLNKVWGDYSEIEERTVDVHILRLRKALKEAEYLIKTVRGAGYMLSEK